MDAVHLSSTLQKQLRATFTQDAELYDRCRPRYPQALFNDLALLTQLGPESNVLEIGPGTGQATLPLARLGCRILAIELGAGMATVAQRNLAAFSNVEVVISAFEDWHLPDEKFDLVVSAAAFHWVDENVRMSKAADALRAGGGALAVISTHHIKGDTETFFNDVWPLYEQFGVAPGPGLCLQTARDIPEDGREFEQEKRFGKVEFRKYEWDEEYSTSEYIDLLSTYSNHRILSGAAKEGLFSAIAELIDNKYQGQIAKRYMVQMALTHRL